LAAFKEARDQAELDRRLEALRDVARGEGKLLPPIKEALQERRTTLSST